MPLEQDVLEVGKQLEKLVADGKSDNETALDLLKRLKELPITLDILQKTRIGMAVNVVRKGSSREEIQSIAKTLIKSWKKLLDGDKPKTQRQPSQSDTPSTKNNLNRSDSSSSSSSINNGKNITISFPPNKGDKTVRTQCVNMIKNSLKSNEKPDFDAIHISKDIEEAIFQQFNDTNVKYRNKVKSRVMNLRDKRNPELMLLIMDGIIAPEKFANMTAEELACDELRKQRADITKQAIKDHQLATTVGTTTGQFKCNRCGKRNTTYNQVQTRSADEPMTTFVFCQECGNRWKFC